MSPEADNNRDRETRRPAAIDEIAAILRAAAAGELHSPRAAGLDGLSGDRLIALLCSLVGRLQPERECYLEVGVFQGFTLLSVAKANPALTCFGVDNFSGFDLDGRNRAIVESRRSALGANNAHVIDRDYEDALAELDIHIGARQLAVYFVDGPHDYRSQLMCLILALPFLSEHAVIVIDDCNYPHVRQANRDFLVAFPDFRLLFEAYTPRHPLNMDANEIEQARRGYWNGVNVLGRDPSRSLAVMAPITERDRTLYVNEHIVHSSNLARLVPQLLDVVQPLTRRPTLHDLAQAVRGLKALLQARWIDKRLPAHRSANTHSEALPTVHLHPEL